MARKDFSVDTRQLERLEYDLNRFSRKALPFATKNTLNTAAFQARGEWRGQIDRKMIARNAYTKNSIRVEQTRSLIIGQQEAVVGSIADYMDEQEFGGVKRRQGKQGVALTTSYASGEGEGARPRRRLARGANQLRKIKLSRNRIRAKSRAQRNFLAVRGTAVSSSQKFVYLETGRKEAIYKVVGRGDNAKVKMVHDLSRDSVSIPRNPTMGPAVAKVERRMGSIHRDSLVFQIKKQRLFQGGRR